MRPDAPGPGATNQIGLQVNRRDSGTTTTVVNQNIDLVMMAPIVKATV